MSLRSERTRELYNAFYSVETNGQVQEWAARAIAHGQAAASQFSAWSPDPSHHAALRDIKDAVADVVRYSGPFSRVDPSAPFAESSWIDLRKAIGRLYSILWSVEDVLAGESTLSAWLDFIGTVSSEAVRAVPKVVREALDYGRELARPLLELPKNLFTDLLKAAWPFLLVGGALVGVGIYVAVKHPKVLAGAL